MVLTVFSCVQSHLCSFKVFHPFHMVLEPVGSDKLNLCLGRLSVERGTNHLALREVLRIQQYHCQGMRWKPPSGWVRWPANQYSSVSWAETVPLLPAVSARYIYLLLISYCVRPIGLFFGGLGQKETRRRRRQFAPLAAREAPWKRSPYGGRRSVRWK